MTTAALQVGARWYDTRRSLVARWSTLALAEALAVALALGLRRVGPVNVAHAAGALSAAGILVGIALYRRGAPLPVSAGRVEPWLIIATGVAVLGVTGGVNGAGSGSFGVLALTPYPFFVAGLLGLVSGRLPGRVADVLVQAGLISTALSLVLWSVVHADGHVTTESLGTLIARIAVPGLDAVLLTITVRLLLIGGERLFVYWGLLLAISCSLGAHVLAAMAPAGNAYPVGQLAHVLFAASIGLWAVGALHPSMVRLFEPLTDDPPSLSAAHFLLIEIGMLIAPVVIGVQSRRPGVIPPPVAHAAVVISLVLVVYAGILLWQRSSIERRTHCDELTGLPNRTLFFDRLCRALAHAHRNDLPVAIMFVDLDRFKQINDSFGHTAGDELLRHVADRLQSCIRQEDTVARLGGDEFALLIPHVSGVDGAVALAQRLLASFTQPVPLSRGEVVVTPSIGLSLFPQDGTDPNDLIEAADAAMYRAKEQGRNTFEIFSPVLRARVHERLAVEAALHHALTHNELVLHYQPKVDVRSGTVTGAEALVRWEHPEQGLLYPGSFVPVAEQSGQVVALGEYVLTAAVEQLVAWQRQGLSGLTVSVNVSARQLQHGLVDFVAALLDRTRLRPDGLELELTESALLQNIDMTVQELNELRAMGLRLSIDDFGTGYSGLSYLNRLPIDTLKIDKSFVDGITAGGDPIVDAVIALGHSLQLKVIAEGVETHDQLAYLARQGCDEVQGYLFSRPIPPDDFAGLLLSYRSGGGGQLPLLAHASVEDIMPVTTN